MILLLFRSFLVLFFAFTFCACGGDSSSSSSKPSKTKEIESPCESGWVFDDEETEETEETETSKDAEEEAEESESQDPHCRLPKTGHFANEAGEEEACTPIENITDGTNTKEGLRLFLPNTAPLAEDACPFKCVAGFVASSSERTCEIPPSGEYADGDGVAQGCSAITGAVWEENTGPVTHPNECAFSCTTGTKTLSVDVNDGGSTTSVSARLCLEGNQGLWNDDPNDVTSEKSCRPIEYQSGWVTPSGALPTTDVCDYTCQMGYLKGEVDTDTVQMAIRT